MKIYFAASIRGGRDDAPLYQALIDDLNTRHTVLTEHIGNPNLTADGQTQLTDQAIRDRDINWLQAADIVVAETTNPSLGVGYELAYAEKIKTPVLILHRDQESHLSAMIKGTGYFDKIFNYRTVADALVILQRELP